MELDNNLNILIISSIGSTMDRYALQIDLNKAFEWSKLWMVDFNLVKCLVMHYGSSNPNYTYNMGTIELGTTKCERDLGVVFSADLKWKQQVIACSSKANSMLGLIKKTFVSFDVRLVRILYTVYVRPLIEFAVPVWNPSLTGDMELLEKVQHRATRLVPMFKKLPYDERLRRLNLPTLERRRVRGDLVQFFKIVKQI